MTDRAAGENQTGSFKARKKAVFRVTALLAAAVLCAGLLSACSAKQSGPDSVEGFYFDTYISIRFYDPVNEDIKNGCLDLCDRYEQLFSPTIETSDICRINTGAGRPVKVDPDTIELLKEALYYSDLTGGAFSPAVKPLTDLWNVTGEDPQVPDEDSISEALKHTDPSVILIEGDTVTLTDEHASVDPGGIAKGYVADKLKEYLESENVTHVLINLGGNVLAVGGKPDHSSFTIGIQKPFGPDGTAAFSVGSFDDAVVSSGQYQRYFEENGKVYGHILDPSTGFPVDNDLLQVTVKASSSTMCDALSTACFVMGSEEGLAFIRSLEGVEAVFMTENSGVISSDAAALPIVK